MDSILKNRRSSLWKHRSGIQKLESTERNKPNTPNSEGSFVNTDYFRHIILSHSLCTYNSPRLLYSKLLQTNPNQNATTATIAVTPLNTTSFPTTLPTLGVELALALVVLLALVLLAALELGVELEPGVVLEPGVELTAEFAEELTEELDDDPGDELEDGELDPEPELRTPPATLAGAELPLVIAAAARYAASVSPDDL
jgi:hypothetical protein